MSAHPWLSKTPWPTKQIDRNLLTEKIEHFLATHWMGVLCTIGKDGPIGSPVEYYAEGSVVYVLPQPGSPKIKAMQTQPNICFAVYGENSGWASVHGTQLFAQAQLLDPGTPEHDHAMTIYRWEPSAIQLGKPLHQPPQMQLLKIDPYKIAYTAQWPRHNGFGPRQIWYKAPEQQTATIEYGH